MLMRLEGGELVDLQVASQTFGSTIEYLLGDLLSNDDTASRYWIDGFIIDEASLLRLRVVLTTGRAWCADHARQWQVPAQVASCFSSGPPPVLESLAIRIGNAKLPTLDDHRGRSIVKTSNLTAWLHEFSITRPAALAIQRDR